MVVLEGDALLVVLAINNPSLFSSWDFANCLADVSLILSSFQSWNALKVFRSVNFRAHVLDKWVVFRLFLEIFSQDLLFSFLFR